MVSNVLENFLWQPFIKELKQLDNGNIPWKRVIALIKEDTINGKTKEKSSDAVNIIKENNMRQ